MAFTLLVIARASQDKQGGQSLSTVRANRGGTVFTYLSQGAKPPVQRRQRIVPRGEFPGPMGAARVYLPFTMAIRFTSTVHGRVLARQTGVFKGDGSSSQ